REAVLASFNQGILSAPEAQAAKLVDALGYDDEVQEELRRLADGGGAYHGIGVRKYLERDEEKSAHSGSRVAVVFGSGPISSGSDESLFDDKFSGPAVARAIRKAADDSEV